MKIKKKNKKKMKMKMKKKKNKIDFQIIIRKIQKRKKRIIQMNKFKIKEKQ